MKSIKNRALLLSYGSLACLGLASIAPVWLWLLCQGEGGCVCESCGREVRAGSIHLVGMVVGRGGGRDTLLFTILNCAHFSNTAVTNSAVM